MNSKDRLNLNKKERIGQETYNKNGELMKCIEYINANNIIVEFQDQYKKQVTASWKNFKNGDVKNPYKYIKNRIGKIKINNAGETMKVVEYINNKNIIVEFQDEFKERIKATWKSFEKGEVRNPHIKQNRLYNEKYNNQGCLMKCIEYINADNIVVKFIDNYGYQRKATWKEFCNGAISNLYFPNVYNVGIVGSKYPTKINGKHLKEYQAWRSIIQRCFDKKTKEKYPTYKDVTCCDEWLLYENFYEWLHSQENFNKWLNGNRWAVDKDILIKGNKIYSPETCCLVPIHINSLFVKKDINRGTLPIGVQFDNKTQRYSASISKSKNNSFYRKTTGRYPTPEDAFYLGYKPAKEEWIKQMAQEEYNKGNIIKKCYEAMMNYQVEITD